MINQLDVGDVIRVGDLDLPDGVTIENKLEELVCHVKARGVLESEDEETALEGEGGSEPEVIGKKKDGEE